MNRKIVVLGNAGEGITFYGPFPNFTAANKWARALCDDYYIVPMHAINLLLTIKDVQLDDERLRAIKCGA